MQHLPNSAVGRALGLPGRRSRGPSGGELGRQPDPYARAVLEVALGRDLGHVRLRSGPAQDALLDDLGVDALAHGREIAIRRRHDVPGTLGGRALLLHELVHVLQQQGADDRSTHEQEAEARRVSVEVATRPPGPRGGSTAARDGSAPAAQPA